MAELKDEQSESPVPKSDEMDPVKRKRNNQLASIRDRLKDGKIENFHHIFDIRRRTTIAKDLDIPFSTFTNKLNQPGTFTSDDIINWADLIGIDYHIFNNFIYSQILDRKEKLKKGTYVKLFSINKKQDRAPGIQNKSSKSTRKKK